MADRGWPDDWNERMAGRECPIFLNHLMVHLPLRAPCPDT
jgi:hypothetical protein